MNKEELKNIKGGAITASLLNSIIRGIITICDLGKSVGSAIRRALNGNTCPLN